MATLNDPEELWRKVIKWSIAAFVATVVVLLVVVVALG